MKKFFKVFIILSTVFLMLCIIAQPKRYTDVALKGILLWATTVLPSLFPFFFLTLILTKIGVVNTISKHFEKLTQKIFKCNGVSSYVFLMSILSGYPVGAKLISELHNSKQIDKYEATRMATFCSTSGPLFITGTVGANMFENNCFGLTMLFCHVISAIICGIIFANIGDFRYRHNSSINPQKNENALYECVYSSTTSIICVGGFICIFYLISTIIKDCKLLLPIEWLLSLPLQNSSNNKIIIDGFLYGLIECTNGCNILSQYSVPLTASIACANISFGGISIILQSIIYLKKANVNIKIFILSKILQMVISFILCLTITNLFSYFT